MGLKEVRIVLHLNKMVRKSSDKASASASSSVVENIVPVVVEEVPVVAKKSKKTKPVVVDEVVAPVVAPVVVETTSATDEEIKTEVVIVEATKPEIVMANRCLEFGVKLHTVNLQLASIRMDFKQLEKQLLKEIKILQKGKGKKKYSGNRKPSGFVKPAKISDELAEFLGKPIGSELARTEVSKEIHRYINTHNLKDPVNGRNIIPDSKLTVLLKLTADDNLNYFNLQKFMKNHFIKTVVPDVGVVSV